jgi:inosine-uridine nucleoside N-ribohydrolase
MASIPVILDCDPGHDDALAIILAAFDPRISLLAITTVAGNGPIEKVTENALRICALAGINVPVARGAAASLRGLAESARNIHGKSALDGAELPMPTFAASQESAVELIARIIRTSTIPVSLVATGPLTNIATFIREYPELLPKVKDLTFMGGSAGRGNRTPYAEFNIWVDPEAADIVVKSGLKMTMCGLDVTHQALVTREIFAELAAMQTSVATTIIGLLKFFAHTYDEVFGLADPPLHDPVAIAVVANSAIAKSRMVNVEVELESALTRGATVVDLHEVTGRAPNLEIALDLDVQLFWQGMLAAIAKSGAKTAL